MQAPESDGAVWIQQWALRLGWSQLLLWIAYLPFGIWTNPNDSDFREPTPHPARPMGAGADTTIPACQRAYPPPTHPCHGCIEPCARSWTPGMEHRHTLPSSPTPHPDHHRRDGHSIMSAPGGENSWEAPRRVQTCPDKGKGPGEYESPGPSLDIDVMVRCRSEATSRSTPHHRGFNEPKARSGTTSFFRSPNCRSELVHRFLV